MLRFGIHTIGEAADTPCEVLQRILGPSAGKSVYQSARGINHSAVRRERPQAKSHSVERTTTTDIEKRNAATELPPLLSELAEELSSRLRKANVRAETLVIIAKTSSFQRHTRQQRLLVPSNEKEVLEASARELFSALLEGEEGLFSKREALRLVGIGAARLEDPQYQQLSLFSLPSPSEVREAKQRAAEAAAEAENVPRRRLPRQKSAESSAKCRPKFPRATETRLCFAAGRCSPPHTKKHKTRRQCRSRRDSIALSSDTEPAIRLVLTQRDPVKCPASTRLHLSPNRK